MAETRRRAYRYAKPMFWPNVGQRYLDIFEEAVAESRQNSAHRFRSNSPLDGKGYREVLLQGEI